MGIPLPAVLVLSGRGYAELRHNGVFGSSGTLRLPKEASWIIGMSPVFDDLAVFDAEHVYGYSRAERP